MLELEESEAECESMSREYNGDPRRTKVEWLKAWLKIYEVPAASLSLFARSALIPAC
jgi:hypothetical protein